MRERGLNNQINYQSPQESSHSLHCSLGRITIHISLPSSSLRVWAVEAVKEESCPLGRQDIQGEQGKLGGQ